MKFAQNLFKKVQITGIKEEMKQKQKLEAKKQQLKKITSIKNTMSFDVQPKRDNGFLKTNQVSDARFETI